MAFLQALRISRAPAAGLAAVGLVWGGLAALVPDIKAAVGASDGQLGLALLCASVGAMVSMLAAPRVGQALGAKALPVLGLVLCGACLLPLAAGGVWSLAAALFGMGLAVSMLDITSNVRVSSLEARHDLHLMNLNHAMFSLAFATSAFLTGIARTAGLGQAPILVAVACTGLAFVALMRPGRGHSEPGPDDGITAPRRPPWGAILLTGLILFAAFIGENAIEAWSALHIERTLGALPGEGGFGPATLGLTMGLGRLAGQGMAARLGAVRLICWSSLLAIAGTLLIAAAPSPSFAVTGVAIAGLGLAVIVPSVNSILGTRVLERQRAFALSRAWMFGFLGFFVGPAMMGGIAELFGLRLSFVAMAVLVAIILPGVLALARSPVPGGAADG